MTTRNWCCRSPTRRGRPKSRSRRRKPRRARSRQRRTTKDRGRYFEERNGSTQATKLWTPLPPKPSLEHTSQIPPFSSRSRGLSVDDAYRVTPRVRQMFEARGAQAKGRKIGPAPALRRRRAAVEPFGEGHCLLIVVTDRPVERVNLHIVLADHQLQLEDAALTQPRFRGVHDRAAKIQVTLIRIDRDVVDPAAMPVIPDHDRCHERAVTPADQHRGIVAAACERNIGRRIVPRAGRSAALPERDDLGDILIFNRRDAQRAVRTVHNTLPGFMMPCGSSIALMPRISSIATLSLTSGSSSRLSTPMPCSAEIDPPMRSTIANTTALTSCQRARKSSDLPPTGWETL